MTGSVMTEEKQAMVLFDGECAYCDSWVRWITLRDVEKHFRFVPLKSEEGIALRKQYDVPDHLDSIILVEDGRAFTRSSAAWRIFRSLHGYKVASFVLRIIPRPFRDLGYDLIARNRHRLKGDEVCEAP